MNIDLTGRTALVTGSTAGIGLAVAVGLAGAGATVLVNGRTQQRVDDALAAVRDQVPGADVRGAVADIGTADGVATLVAAEPDVDVLVANAGVFEPTPFAEIGDDAWQQVWDVNVMSGVRLARHHVPRMVDRGWGRVVFISSESALHIPAEMVHYGVSKTAMLAVARGIAESYPASGVTANSVLPGPTRTEGVEAMLAGRDGSFEDKQARFFAEDRPSSLIQRFAEPSEVAAMVTYVCSPQASATTGAALRVDGGVVRAIG
ncbi:SDR family NAD(P)-dependent oxidoreductase [Solicola sp. PLA-1-18]|uniref:SDR family NAD(P)-dependent oxidoreductase n=1 Tax=Solicola sp. PLA-1-18 TaxID=3380532 RepID=UPI003B7DD052